MAVLFAATALAHQLRPEEVIARLSAPETRAAFAVTAVERNAALPRLLLVRVGSGWNTAPTARRRQAAEEWYQLWRHSVAGGILAIVDASDRPLVNFDAEGRAALHDVQPPEGTPGR